MRRSHGSWQAYRRQVVWSAPPFEKPKHAVRPTIGLATRFHRGRPSCERREIGLTKSDFALFWSEAKVRALPCLGSPPNELEPILARGCKSDRRAARTLRQVCSIDAQDRVCPCAGFGRAFVRENSQEPRRREGGGCRSRLQRRQVSPVRSDIQSAARSPERTAHRRVRRFIARRLRPRARDRRRDKRGAHAPRPSRATGPKQITPPLEAAPALPGYQPRRASRTFVCTAMPPEAAAPSAPTARSADACRNAVASSMACRPSGMIIFNSGQACGMSG